MKKYIRTSQDLNDIFLKIEDAVRKVIFDYYRFFNDHHTWTDEEDYDGDRGYRLYEDLKDFDCIIEKKEYSYRIKVLIDRHFPWDKFGEDVIEIAHKLNDAVTETCYPYFKLISKFTFNKNRVSKNGGYFEYSALIEETGV